MELAWRLVRFQPDTEPVLNRRETLCKGALATGAARKKAIVAVARQAGRRSMAYPHRPGHPEQLA